MADHISYWLRDLGMVQPIDSFEAEFANGYKFGELLYRLDVFEDYDYLKDRSNKEWKVKNFAEIEKGLRHMKLKFESKLINQIMDEERGAALRLLFQIKLNREQAMNQMTMTGLKPEKVIQKLQQTHKANIKANRLGIEPTFKSTKLRNVEKKLLKFEERKEMLELKAIKEQQREDQLVHEMLMDRRRRQIELLKENKEFMEEWERKGKKDWGKNKRTKLERIRKEEILEKALTDKHINKIKNNMVDATEDVVGGIDSFEKNLARIGIENEPNLEALDESKKQPVSKKPLGGFSFPATMMKIKEKKEKGDFARKERDIRQRKLKVVQAQTQEQVKLKNREEELLAKFTIKTKEETDESYLLWRKRRCHEIEAQNKKTKSDEVTRKKEMELKKLQDEEDKNKAETLKKYEAECNEKRKEIQNNRLNKFLRKKEVHSVLMKDVVRSILDVVEELHVTCKGGITKPRWREIMRRFKNNEQIYTHQQAIIQQEPEEESEEEVDMTEENEDYNEFQDYLSVVGKWNPRNIHFDDQRIINLARCENVEIPNFEGYINNNRILGKAAKEINCLAYEEETQKVLNGQIAKIKEKNDTIPSYMPLKLIMFGDNYEYSQEIVVKFVEEYNLKVFNVNELSEEINKIMNPPEEEEPEDKKKGKGKKDQEEPPENEEELKELSALAEKIKQYREDNPGIESLTEDQIMEILCVKIKNTFEKKTQIEVLNQIKEGIKNDIFRDPEDEGDAKKAKGKGPSKEELEEELFKYKKVQPSGYIIVNAPKTYEMLLQFEKILNGYTPLEERQGTQFELDRDQTDKFFPCSLSERQPYYLEPSENYIINRSLTLTREIIEEEITENKVIIIEKNSPSELQKRMAVIGTYNGTHTNLYEDFGTERIHIPYKFIIDTTVVKEIPPAEEGQEPTEKTPEEIQEEIMSKFRKNVQKILDSHQKVLDQIIEENIEVVRSEVEEEKARLQEEAEQEENAKEKEQEPKEVNEETKNEGEGNQEGEGEGEAQEGEGGEENEEEEEEPIGLHPKVVAEIKNNWQNTEKEYTKTMILLFNAVRSQNSKIQEGIEEMKDKFKEFLMRPDKKQDKLEHYIKSFNKFTEEFPELRPDEQTKEELNNRLEVLNEEFWDIIEIEKDDAIAERQRLIDSGWIETELQQLTIKAQQFFSNEIKRCINSLNFIHSFYLASKEEKPLSEYENRFPQKFSLSLLDESTSEAEKVELPQVEDVNDPDLFPFLDAIFAKGICVVNDIEQGSLVYDQSEFEILNSIEIEKKILIFRLLSIRSWVIRGLKEVRHKIKEAYDILDDWIVVHIKNENDNVNKIVDSIRDVIETVDPLDPNLKIEKFEFEAEEEDQIQFIETVVDKSFIHGKSKSKFSLTQAKEYLDLFKILTRDGYISKEKAKDILVTNMKLVPDLVPQKWKEHSLKHLDSVLEIVTDEETGIINWRHFLTYCILEEAFIPMIAKDSITNTYREILKKTLDDPIEQYITLEKFLGAACWYDKHLSTRKKEEVVYEEDKQEIDQEIKEVKELLYQINISENGLLHIDNFVDTINSLWQEN